MVRIHISVYRYFSTCCHNPRRNIRMPMWPSKLNDSCIFLVSSSIVWQSMSQTQAGGGYANEGIWSRAISGYALYVNEIRLMRGDYAVIWGDPWMNSGHMIPHTWLEFSTLPHDTTVNQLLFRHPYPPPLLKASHDDEEASKGYWHLPLWNIFVLTIEKN